MKKKINPSNPLEVSVWVKKWQAEMKKRKKTKKLSYPRNIEKRVKDWGWLDEK